MVTDTAMNLQDSGLEVAAMLAHACVATGLSDFGDDGFEQAFNQLVDSVNAEVVLSPIGAMGFKADMHRLLVNRLRFADDLKRHPEILDEDVSDPIIILGLARTGTTKLQRMMAADPDAQRLEFWRLYNPAPFPGAIAGETDPRIVMARQLIGMLQQISPGFMAAHPTQAEEVDEELLLQEFTFKTNVHYLRTPAHGYYRWLQSQALRDTYDYLKRLLQYLQWQDGGGNVRNDRNSGRPWILKSPMHIGNLDSLVEVFPQATLVHSHRDVTEIIPSFCRLMEMGWRMKTDHVDRKQVGQAVLTLWSEEMRNYLRQRDRLGASVSIHDVQYAAIKDDPIAVIREIYSRAGRRLTPVREQAMRQWAAHNPQDRHGKNMYSLEEFGLTTDTVKNAFKDYIDRFGC